jgi:DNA-binding LacI/PurR family transcriptional regulator
MEELQSSDLGAVGLLDRLGQWGAPVPHDISVTGCDNVSVSRLASPKLSTVNSRVQIGRARVDLLLSSARGWADVQSIREMPIELVMGEPIRLAGLKERRRESQSVEASLISSFQARRLEQRRKEH